MEGDKNDLPTKMAKLHIQTDSLRHCSWFRSYCKSEKGNFKPRARYIVNPELLKKGSNSLPKNPEQYENEYDRKRRIGLANGARKGDVIEYFELYNKEAYSLNPQDISSLENTKLC
jgi:hypothetical protein